MIDKKDPRQDPVKSDSSDDDDVIIDLTEEVKIETEENDGITERTDGPDLAFETDNDENLNDLTAGESPSIPDASDENPVLELDDPLTDDETDMGEDDLLASAANDSLLLDEDESSDIDDDEPSDADDEFDFKASDDDVIIMDNEQSLADENLPDAAENASSGDEGDTDVVIVNNAPLDTQEYLIAIEGNSASETRKEESIFDLEEEIDLEYELDEDEDELIALEDERAEDQADFGNMVPGENAKTGRRDPTEEPTEYLNLDSYQRYDIMDMNEAGDETPPDNAVMDLQVLKDEDIEELPDLAAVPGLDFEDDDESENEAHSTGEKTDSGDKIIARAAKRPLVSSDETERFEPAAGTEFEQDEDADIIALDADSQKDDQLVKLEDTELLQFEDDKNLLVDLDDATALDDDDEIIPLENSDGFYAGRQDDIVEITEFDQHYPTDSDKMLQRAGILDPADDEEDEFIELIDMEEDRQAEDEEEILGIGESDDKGEDTALDNFFDEDLEEGTDQETDEAAFKALSSDDSALAEQEAQDAAAAPESAAADEASDSKEEDFDFDFDPGAIARQIDGLDAFLSEDSLDEPEAPSLPEDYTPGEDARQENFAAEPDSEEFSAPSPERIDAVIERVINEKFAGKIEDIIYEVIEKAVAKEIDRLKSVLLGSIPPDDTD